MDREIAPEVQRRRLLRRTAIAVAALAALFLVGAASLQWIRPSVRRSDIETARVTRGAVDSTLQASGTILPAAEQVVSSPVEARLLRVVRRAGDRVHAGDEIVVLDTSASKLDSDRLADQVAQKESELAELRLKVEDTLATLDAQIRQKELDADIVRFKAEQNAKLHKEGLVAAQEDLAAATSWRKSVIELAQLREGVIRARRTGDAQLAAAAASLRTLVKERDEAVRQLGLAMMRADRDGVVTWIVQDAGSTVRRGDVIARVADLSSYRVSATISDLHAVEITPGMKARVKIDDRTSIDGTVSSVDPRIESGAAKFWVELREPSHPKLRNNARVDVYVVTGSRRGVLRVRRGTLGQSAVEDVFVVRRGELVSVPVRWGLTGDETLEVASGLAAGDEIVVSNMNDFQGVRKLRLK